jgi:hypothetical protein
MRKCAACLCSGVVAGAVWMVAATAPIAAQEAKGSIRVNGKSGSFAHAYAMEIDSESDPGYLDVRVVLSDRELSTVDRRDDDRLMQLTHDEGLVALVVVLDPDARPKSATPYHPAFTAIISSGAFIRWEPSAYDDNVAGRFDTDGPQEAFNQTWEYDVTFSAPIELDPEAQTVD